MKSTHVSSVALCAALTTIVFGCSDGTKPCNPGTVLVTVTFDDATKAADSIEVDVSVSGAAPKKTTLAHKAGEATGSVEVFFPSGYPEGKRLDVTVVAVKGTSTLGTATLTVTAVPKGCGAVALKFSGASPSDGGAGAGGNAGTTNVGDGGLAGAGGNDAGVAGQAGNGADGGGGQGGATLPDASSNETSPSDGGTTDGPSEGGTAAPELLTVAKAGNGTGAVTSAPAGVSCGTDCSESYPAGTMVTLTATPDVGSTFGGWSGGGCSGAGTCAVTVNAASTVTATFTLKTWMLTTTLAGTGGGAITSVPAGITCGATCAAAFNNGTMVALTATPNGQSLFTAWSGACTGSGTCMVTMDQARSVTATFTQQSFGLTVTKAGNGAALGTVTSAPAGITCGADCSEAYGAGTVVTLTATPAAGASFTSWSGGGCSGTSTCVVTINAIVNVTATFTLTQSTLTVVKAGTGTGTVTSTPAGINCGATCNEQVDFGGMVTLNAVSGAGSMFTGWAGGGCTGVGACIVTVNAATMVTATFTLQQFPLMVVPNGSGSGVVTSNVGGLSCGATCQANLNYGTMVTLTAAPAASSTFAGWSGGGCSGTGTCVVNVQAATVVNATFSKSSWVLTVTFQGASAGSVAVAPGGGTLATSAMVTLAAGAAVSLTATPAASVGFGGWGGACSGFGACAFALNADTTVTVRFDPPNKAFVTSTAQAPGALGGLAGADAICAARATAGGLTGTFKAFLGATNATAWSRLAGARGWARVDGKAFGDQVSDLMAGRTYYPLILNESGAEIAAGGIEVATGVNGGATQSCMDWSSTGGGSFDVTWGDPRSGYLTFVQNGGTACNNVSTHLYCFEVARNVLFKPAAMPAGGRRAFLSSGNLTANGGLAAADTQCQNEATTAGFTGTYKALLAGNGATAASRLGGGNAWYRADNVQLSATAADLLGGATELWAAMSLRADGLTQEQALVWTGAATVATAGTAASTCTGWTSTGGAAAAMTYGNRMGTDWFGPFSTGDCTDTHRVFCFQQ